MSLSRTGFARSATPLPARVQVDPRIAARIQVIRPHSDRVAVIFQGQSTTYDSPEARRDHMQQVYETAQAEKARRAWDDRGLLGLPYRLAADVDAWAGALMGAGLALTLLLIERVAS